MEEDKIKQLMDMGFTQEQASDALSKANNDSERAVAYLFGEPLEDKPDDSVTATANSTPTVHHQVIKYEDTVAVRNPQDIPVLFPTEKPLDYGTSLQYGSQQFDTPEYTSNDYQYNDYQLSDSSIYEAGIFDQIGNFQTSFQRQENVPPIILPRQARVIDNYVLPMLMIFAQIAKFDSFVFEKKDMGDWEYDSNWFKQQLLINPPVDESDPKKYKFHAELQRLVAFLSDLSHRAFVSSDNLCLDFGADFRRSLNQPSGEDIEEFIKRFYHSLSGISGQFDSLFKSVVESTTENAKNDFYTFIIDTETRCSNLHESLNSLFWTDDDNIGSIRFVDVAPILTIELCGDDDGFQVEPFEIQEDFYPEIYSGKFSKLIYDLHERRIGITQERVRITNEIMTVNAFEGKIVRNFLTMSIDHLQNAGKKDASDDLQNLKTKIIETRTELTNKLTELNVQYAKLDYTNYDNILTQIKESGLTPPSKYILLGAIVSDTEYFYRSKMLNGHEEDWFYVCGIQSQSDENVIVDYAVETINFAGVKAYILEHTKHSSKQLVLLYGEEALYNEDIAVEYPAPIKKFFEQDNIVLKDLQEMKDQDSNNEAYDDDKDTPEDLSEEEHEENEEQEVLVDI